MVTVIFVTGPNRIEAPCPLRKCLTKRHGWEMPCAFSRDSSAVAFLLLCERDPDSESMSLSHPSSLETSLMLAAKFVDQTGRKASR